MTEQLLTVQQIDAKIAELEKLRKDVETKEALRKQVEELIAAEGYSLEDIFPELRKPAPAPAPATKSGKSGKSNATRTPKDKLKYIHRDDPTLRYGGRGPKPQWVVDATAAGTLEDHLNPDYVDPTATPTVAPTAEPTGGLGKEQAKALIKKFTS